ncbi:hypothetical protein, conserved [Babesia ovata]|uniref:Extracellular matrix-binding ebh n=1 Tax=Babesia ovata TaxID=189622 RepID=A0A2H6KAI4_9APIC|nr:uncharacterized protein BOVATA_014930 [Babesia ovata]GBE60000.1 hypothetical protein, conserved [Babesia ovata]
MVSLADLSGKLGQFIGQSDAVTKAINDAITAIINSHDEFKSLRNSPSSPAQSSGSVPAELINVAELLQKIQHFKKEIASLEKRKSDQNPSLSSEDSRLLSSHQSKLQSLQRLKSLNESLSSLNKQQSDNCKNLLTNLTDGLEKFLGFNSTSKGYDGTGIVYSDLDRLCDGVMSFLHGVLNEVYKNENLSPYAEKLTQAVSLLETHRYNGQTGLRTVIDTVKEGIGQWLGDVKTKNDGVKKSLETLLSGNKIKNITKLHTTIQTYNGMDYNAYYASQLSDWLHHVEQLPTYCGIISINLHKLDDNVENKLSPHVSLIKDRVDTFVDSTKKDHEGLKEVCERVDEHVKYITNYADGVQNEVENNLDIFFENTETELQHLQEKSRQLYKSCWESDTRLAELAKSAEAALAAAQQNCDKVGALNGKIKKDLHTQSEKVWRNSLAVDVNGIKGEIQGLLTGVDTAIEKLSEALVGINLKSMKDMLHKFNREDIQNMKNAIEAANGEFSDSDVGKYPSLNYFKYIVSQDTKGTSIFEKLKKAIEPSPAKTPVIKTPPAPKAGVEDTSPAGQVDAAIKAVADNVSKLDTEFNDKIKNSLDDAVGQIRKTVASLLKESAAIANPDCGIPYDVPNLYHHINTLRLRFQEFVTTVKDANLNYHIKCLKASFKEGKQNMVKHITGILTDIKSLATTAATSIKRQALSQFAQSKARALEQLKALVTEQKTKIEEIIQKDSDSGLKGLMKWMNGGMHQDPASKQITPGSKFEEFISAATKLNQTPQQGKEYHEKFCDLSTKFKDYVAVILQYIEHQVKTPIPDTLERNPTDQSERVKDIKSIMDNLLAYLKSSDKICHFDHVSTSYLDALNASLLKLSPSTFAGFHNPLLLDALRSGMEKFTEQLGHAYVNKYSGCKPVKNWDDVKSSDKLSTEGRNCAKVCLTILEIFSHDLNELKHQCETNWKNRKICLKNGNGSINDLGLCLKRFGYGVPSREDVQDDELRCSKYMNGNEIFAKLTIPTITERDEYNVISTLKHICDNLLIYYRVCHYSTLQSKTYPSSVYQMLLWLAGLPYNPVYDDLSLNGFGSLLDKPEEQDTDTGDESLSVDVDNGDTDESRITLKDENEESLDAYKEKITVPKLYEALAEACSHAHSVLTSILGHGHAGGIYAVDFNTNEDKFSYPSDMNSLICMLFEIVKRLHDQLYFLYRQCMHDSKLSGWSDCWYGHDIGGTAWKCNTLQCPNQSGDQIANQTHKQTCNQKCNQSVSCGVKSPLQSFLEDGLQGFLPHSLKSERGKLECSVKPHFNLPCKTPMGFSDISHMASHRQTGRHIREALFDVCSGEWSAFSRLCSLLNCLLPSAPKTLDDMFGFYFNLVNGWNKTAKQAFDNAINEANFNRTNARLDISAILKSNDHGSGDNMPHLKGDLHSLVDCKYNGESHPAYPCGPYVQPLCYYRCGIFAAKNNDKYVSWIVYLTESFLELLEKLYEECCKNCDSATSKCKISKCKDDCKAKDAKMSVASTHNGSCNSIVHCNLMRPTMYRCGFVFQSIYKLSGTKSVETKRTCKDFCNALKKVINKEEKLQHVLAHFVYRTIPEYLLKIRFPFMSLLLTLWSLSLLYLLHITVVRLDVLRIRSHLRSPSSHRIAAQSLLAAARVKALANVNVHFTSSNCPLTSFDLPPRPPSSASIDWLIQVKHGNGGEGLKNLADALKKLIGDAIKSATDSLKNKEDELNCSGNSWDGNSHCNTLQEQIAKANESGDEKEISKAQSKYNGHYSEVHGSDSKRDRAKKNLGELQKKLEGFIGEDKDNAETCKNLLTNLTEGLEKFLGFKPDSKGYDGTGIVYSDLDRLCDGVMSFLLECLKGSRDLLHHYFPDITRTISELEGKIGKGSGVLGFAQAIGRVQQGLQGYDDELGRRTGKVVDELVTLQFILSKNVDDDFNGTRKNIEGIQNQFRQCVQQAKQKMRALKGNPDGYAKLDKDLREQLKASLGKLESAIKVLERSSVNTWLEKAYQHVDERFAALPGDISYWIDKNVMNEINILKWRIETIKKKFDDGNKNNTEDVQGKLKSIESAKTEVTNVLQAAEEYIKKFNMGNEYENKVTEAFQALKALMKNVYEDIEEKKMKIDEPLDTVSTEVRGLCVKVESDLETLRNHIWELTTGMHSEPTGNVLVKKALEDLKSAKQPLDKITVSKESSALPEDGNLELRFDGVIHQPLNSKVKAVDTAIGALCKAVGESEKQTVTAFLENVSKQVEDIGKIGQDSDQLNNLFTAVTDYVGWAGDGFDKKVQQWVGTIVDTAKTEASLYLYLTAKTQDANWKTISEVKEKIKSHVFKEITQYGGDKPALDANNVQTTLSSVKTYLMKIPQSINPNLKASSIAQAIDPELRTSAGSFPPTKSDLEVAVTTVLAAISAKATKDSAEIGRFTDSPEMTFLNGVIGKTLSLAGQIGRALNADVDGKLSEVSDQVKKLNDTFKYSVKNGLETAVSAFNNAAISQIKSAATAAITAAVGKFKGDSHGSIKLEKNGLMSSFEGANEKLTMNIPKIQEEIVKLKGLNERVDSAEKGMNAVIADQNKALVGFRKEINAAVSSLIAEYQKLTQQLAVIKTHVNEAFEHAIEVIKTIKVDLKKEIQRQIVGIQNDVRSMFAAQKKADLEALKECVKMQSEQVQRIIHNNKHIGLKGFIAKVKEKFVTPLNIYLTPAGPQARGAAGDPSQHKQMHEIAEEVRKNFVESFKTLYLQADFKLYFENVHPLSSEINVLLTGLIKSGHVDHNLSNNLDSLKTQLATMTPHKFGEPSTLILQALKEGFNGLTKELDYAYTSTYSGEKIKWEATTDGKKALSNNAVKCANIFVTIIPTLGELMTLNESCMKNEWCRKQVFDANSIPIATTLKSHGYDIPSSSKIQDGELRRDLTGIVIGNIIHKNKELCPHLGKRDGLIQELYDCFQYYYQVRHLELPKSKAYPCSVRDMLSWLTGLPHTRVYKNVNDYCNTLLNDKTNSGDERLLYILKYTFRNSLSFTIQNSYDLLVAIQGHGHGFDQSDYPYACYFRDNSRGFHYPSDVAGLFDMLKDICTRLLRSLYFTYSRCRTPSQVHGWRECSYGQAVLSTNWQCNDHPTGQANTEPKDQPKGQATGQPNDQTSCYPKSPLQAHLMDGLPGMLPHKLSSLGCSSKCSSCPKGSPGQQCITPMGFWDLSTAASVTREGSVLYRVLARFCKNGASPLCSLLRCLLCLLPHPPKSTSDIFALYCNMLQRWNAPTYGHDAEYKKEINAAIQSCFPLSASFHGDYPATKLTDAMQNLYCSDKDHTGKNTDNEHCDLWSISRPKFDDSQVTCSDINPNCAPYLQPLGLHAHHSYAPKHANLYLSWFTYLAWELWNLLESLLNAFKSISCKAHGCSSCNCVPGKHGVCEEKSSNSANPRKPTCHCNSIVDCQGAISTFYMYGFTFRVPGELMQNPTKKTCDDFVNQMTKVLNSQYFITLFDEIDKFFYCIRSPFMTLLLALWSLSLLYLLHIAVVRLDVLRIRSHLRSPSSHRIAAQSLLAAARVRALANVKYNGHYSEVHGSESKRKSAEKDLAERKKCLESLKTSLKIFTESGEECKSLLTNLTDGLEKFLGFNSTSKGYTGDGIVYSDLDRLCDGVMAFLHGVLESVKDDDNVTTYDNNTLNNVLDNLHNNVGKGREAFGVAVTEVGERTGEVKTSLTGLIGELSDDKINRYVQDEKDKKLETQLMDWRKTVTDLEGQLSTIETEKINLLDDSLKAQIAHEYRPLSAAVGVLVRAARDEFVQGQAKKIDTELEVQRSHLVGRISNGCDGLGKMLDNGFNDILNETHRLSDKRKEHFENISQQFKDTRVALFDYFDTTYKAEIETQFTIIDGQMTQINPNKPGPNRSELKKKFSELTARVGEIGKSLQADVARLEKWRIEAIKVVSTAGQSCTEIVGQLDHSKPENSLYSQFASIEIVRQTVESVHSALGRIDTSLFSWIEKTTPLVETSLSLVSAVLKEFDTGENKPLLIKLAAEKLHVDAEALRKAMDAAQKYIQEQVVSAEQAVTRTLKEAVENDLKQLRDKIKVTVGEYFTGLAGLDFKKGATSGAWSGANVHMISGLDNKSQKLKQWLEGAGNSGLANIKNATGLDLSASSGTAALNAALYSLENLKGAIKGSSTTGFGAMKDDAEMKIDKTYGTSGKPVNGNHTSNYEKDKSQVIDRLRSVQGPEGLEKLKKVMSCGDRKPQITDTTLKALYNAVTESLSKLSKAIITHVAGNGDPNDGLQKKLKKLETLISEETKIPVVGGNQEGLGKIKADLHGQKIALDAKAEDIAQAVQGIQSQITAVSKKIKEEPTSSKNSVNDYLSDISSMITQSGDDVQPAATYSPHTSVASVKGLAKINDDMEKILGETDNKVSQNLKSTVDKATIEIGNIIADLEKLPQLVNAKKEAAAYLMDNLKTNLDKNLNAISSALTAAEIDFINAIKAAINSVHKVYTASSKAVAELRNSLLSQVNSSFSILTDDIQRLFAEGHRADLRALKTLITETNTKISDIIDTDKKTGLKGLLKTVSGVAADGTLDTFSTKLGALISTLHQSAKEKRFSNLADNFREYVIQILQYAGKDMKRVSKDPSVETYYDKLRDIFDKLRDLLTHLGKTDRKYSFDNEFVKSLAALKTSLRSLSPLKFGAISYPALDCLKDGLERFTEQLDKAYINAYEGHTDKIDFENLVKTIKASTSAKQGDTKEELSSDGKNCANIFLTCLPTLFEKLYHVFFHGGKDWKTYKIQAEKGNNALRDFMEKSGYLIENLINKDDTGIRVTGKLFDGFNKYGEFNKDPEKAESLDDCVEDFRKQDGPLVKLFNQLNTYYEVCHLKHNGSPKYPCSIRDMLSYFCGLPHTNVYTQIEKYCTDTLNEKDKATGRFPNRDDEVINRILDSNLRDSLSLTCKYAYTSLVAIQGHGHGFDQADYPYACNFRDNSRGFYYPQKVPELLHILKDICRRVLRQFTFLRGRCRANSQMRGWRECHYGRDVGGSSWDCNDRQCANLACPLSPNQKGNQRANQSTNQICEQHPKCGVKSPLQAHLTDSLPGCLPHKLTSVGCSSKCLSCPKGSPGQQCITPMGFWDLSNAGSVTRKGSDLYNVLATFCHNANSPLCALLWCLLCLNPYPPSSLGDMFALYCNAMQAWHSTEYGHSALHKSKINGSIGNSFPFETSLHNDYSAESLTDALYNLHCANGDHNGDPNDNNHCGLQSLSTMPNTKDSMQCSVKGSTCGPYLQPLSFHSYHTFAPKHAGMYLSWIAYLTWNFWILLNELLNSFKNISCKSLGCSSCNCAPGKHGIYDTEKSKESCHCDSIVDCQGSLNTFYKYGLTYRVPKELMKSPTKKTCDDFVNQLTKVLNSQYFITLFDEIDKFFYCIRSPFMLTLLTLWSLSLLYLLHIAVLRLDVLRIRSHLKSPSSHRIAAQSSSPPPSRHSPTSSTSHHNRAFTCDLCITHLITHSPTHSPTHHPLTYSTTHPLTHSTTHAPHSPSATHQLITYSLNRPLSATYSSSSTRGLEKFLGYKKGNYTGDGIVYSDLDRLCDGVMSFILQCLEGAKTLLHHYYPQIIDTIRELEGKIGKGLGVPEFAQAIGIVQAGLERYESGMEERINRFKSWYDAMMNTEIKDLKGEMSTFHDKNLEDQLKAVSSKAKMCLHRATFGEKSKSELDEKLREMLDKPVSLIKQAAHDFREINENGLLNHQARAVDTALQTQQAALNNAINTGSQKFQNTVGGEFDKIRSSLNDLKENTLKTEMQKVRSAVEDAKVFVQDCITDFDKIYEHNILNEFNSINQQMTDITKSNKSVKYESKLFEEVEKLNKAVLELEKLYQGKLVDVKKKVDKAVGLTDNEPGSVLAELTKLDDHLRTDLERVRGDIKLQIDGYIDKQVDAILKAAKKANTVIRTNVGGTGLLSNLAEGSKLKELFNSMQGSTAGNIVDALRSLNSELKLDSVIPIPQADTLQLVKYLKTDIENALKKVIKEPTKNIIISETFMNNYYAQTTKDGRIEGALRTKIKQIKGKFGGGFQGDGENTKIHLETLEGYNTPPSTSSSSEGAKPAYNKAVASVKQMVDKMERLPEFVEQRKLAADEIMKDIKTKFTTLQGMIDDVDLIVNAAEKGLQNAIDSVGNAVKKTEQDITQESKNLQAQLLAAVKSSFDTVKNSVQSLFARQKQAELTQLQTVVDAQLREIERIIREDKATGVKGFIGNLIERIDEEFLDPLPDFPKLDKNITLEQLATKVKLLQDVLLIYVEDQVKTLVPPKSAHQQPQKIENEQSRHVAKIRDDLTNLLLRLTHFNKTSTDNLKSLKTSHRNLIPDKFDGNNNRLLDLVRTGVGGFVEQLEYTYISAYSEETITWEHKTTLPEFLASDDDELTQDATNCAKVFCTIIHPLYEELHQLSENCKPNGNCANKKIDLTNELKFSASGPTKPDINPLGHFLKRCGFRVASRPDISNTELLNKPSMMGSTIYTKLQTSLDLSKINIKIKDNDNTHVNVVDLLKFFYELLRTSYSVTHLRHIPNARPPRSVHHMLTWLIGLPHNPVYDALSHQGFSDLFEKPEDADSKNPVVDGIPFEDENADSLEAYPDTITAAKLSGILTEVCHYAEETIIAIMGHGHAGGTYACEFNTNSYGLSYPSDAGKCLDWLVEICLRINHQLSFLYYQCCNGASSSGWLDCHYGRYVAGSSWQCNEKQCVNLECPQLANQSAKQKTNQIVKQRCDQHPRCGAKSPLQSFLEDGLQGFLPHPYNKSDCKMTCSLPNHRGLPCKTPMGFGDLSVTASHTMRGQHLMKVLARFCGKSDKPLTKFCSYLICVLQTPPQTLDEMFSFYYNFIYGWGDLKNSEHKSSAFDRAVNEASFNRGITLDITKLVDSTAHGENHKKGDLFSLVSCNEKSSPVSPCGSYVHPLSLNARCVFSKKHADKYLSWIVNITEAFYDSLCRLLLRCEGNCGKHISQCRTKGCASDCQAAKSSTHSSSCQSIIQCPHTLPGFYTEGIVFGNGTKIGGRLGKHLKRTCGDFIAQMQNVSRGKTIIAEYIYVIIPGYMFKIRAPFIWTLLALWSLSLLYLLHIAVVRLDVLRIRSHLRSPASHRIAAQSLLAAARVKALANVKYFSP